MAWTWSEAWTPPCETLTVPTENWMKTDEEGSKDGSNISFRLPGPGRPKSARKAPVKREPQKQNRSSGNNNRPKQKKYGRKGPPLLHPKTKLMNSFTIIDMIGGGGYGQVYKAVHDVKKIFVAVKVEPKDHDPGRMVQEQEILKRMIGNKHCPTLYAAGSFNQVHFFVMDLLGPNLSELRKSQKGNRLSVGSTMRVVLQAFDALKSLHDLGYVHRDVKPSNMCIGLGIDRCRNIYIVDFGLARYTKAKDGHLRNPRRTVEFRGTLKYVSVNMHERKEQGPADDFICLFYSAVEMAEGVLPWRLTKNPIAVEMEKKHFDYSASVKHLPPRFKSFYKQLEHLTYKDDVDYNGLRETIQNSIPRCITETTPFDWEISRDDPSCTQQSKSER